MLHRIAVLVLHLVVVFTVPAALGAQPVFFRFVADSIPEADDGGIRRWPGAGGNTATVPDGVASAVLRRDAVNGHAAVHFDGTTFFTTDVAFGATAGGYVLWAVVRWDGTAGANNICSGTNRALWLNSQPYPRTFHNGALVRDAVADAAVTVGGWSIIRVRYDAQTGLVRLAVDNAEGGPQPIEAQTDALLQIGAFQNGNVFHGDIAEITCLAGQPADADIRAMDVALHATYGIRRAADVPPAPVTLLQAPRPFGLYGAGDSLVVRAAITSPTVRGITLRASTAGRTDAMATATGSAGDTLRVALPIPSGLVMTRADVVLQRRAEADTVILTADSIVAGLAIAVHGQSNSIFGDPTLVPTPWGRTVGSNFGQTPGDTTFGMATAVANGYGRSVGGWPLRMQQRLTDALQQPVCIINGGVGGTAIQSHLPLADGPAWLPSLYGSWLHRVRHSGLQRHIRWLFWYQGEANSSADDYETLFGALLAAWRRDLPNLEHVVVIQIHPGCGVGDHAGLRDAQRRLATQFPGVHLHAASGVPGHDGCHFWPAGYRTLGDQLAQLVLDNVEATPETFRERAPRLTAAAAIDGDGRRIRLTFATPTPLAAASDTMVSGQWRTLAGAFFANGDSSVVATAVSVGERTVDLTFDVAARSVSYVPSRWYAGTDVIYAGPWVRTAGGEGALTFHAVSVDAPSTVDTHGYDAGDAGTIRLHRIGEPFALPPIPGVWVAADAAGRTWVLPAGAPSVMETVGMVPGIVAIRSGQRRYLLCLHH